MCAIGTGAGRCAHGDDPDDDARPRRSAASWPSSSGAASRHRHRLVRPGRPRSALTDMGQITTTPKPAGRIPTSAGSSAAASASPSPSTPTSTRPRSVSIAGVPHARSGRSATSPSAPVSAAASSSTARSHGLVHPEFGHMRIPHDRDATRSPAPARSTATAWEGLAVGPALEARWGRPADSSTTTTPGIWRRATSPSAWSPSSRSSRPSGSSSAAAFMKQPGLLALVRQQVRALLQRLRPRVDEREDYIVSPGLGTHAGVLGAIALARTHDHESTRRG